MRRLLIALLLVPGWASAATYYVDCNAGAGGDGSLATPWDAVADVNAASFSAGDSVLFAKGCSWSETLTVPSSGSAGNPITFGAYGSGAKPLISGSDVVSAWTAYSAPLLFYPDADAETTSVDGDVYQWSGDVTWAALRGAGGSGAIPSSSPILPFYIESATQWRSLRRAVFVFDTSSIDDGATITSATMSLYGAATTQDTLGISPKVGVFSSSPASNTDVAAGDFDSLGTTLLSNKIAASAWNASGWNTFTLNASGIAEISKNGVTKLGTRETEYDAANVEPAFVANKEAKVTAQSAEGANPPVLSVTLEGSGPVYQAAVAWEPYVVVEDGVRLTREASLVAVDASGEWYADGATLYIRCSDDAIPSTHTIEAYRRRYGVDIGANSWITVDGLQFTGHQTVAAFEWGSAINISAPSGTATLEGYVIQNNHFFSEGDNCIGGWIGTSANTRTVSGITIDANTFDEWHWGRTTDAAKHAIVLWSGDNADGWTNVTISDNTIAQDISLNPINDAPIPGDGINVILSGGTNVIQRNNVSGCSHGIVVAGLSAGVDLGVVAYNNVHDVADDALWIDANCGALRVYYNILGPTKDCSIDTFRGTAGTQEDLEVYNNLFIDSDNAGVDLKKVTRVTLKNNICSNCGLTNALHVADTVLNVDDNGDSNTTLPTLVSDYNLAFVASGTANWSVNDLANGIVPSVFAAWKTLSGEDTHSVVSDPLFISSSDFRLQAGSPAINAGVDVGLTTDYLGHPIIDFPDIGAYEFDSTLVFTRSLYQGFIRLYPAGRTIVVAP